ncbi:branched-chain amino acid ABC transporter permease [Tianweitania sediminis]|jgi:branched-chain amino acid transport system permease protein|uniref:Branched-chain amino acid ABC transporter permease n=1 Tax=Tianweitania sediminis TaxID=1502156 RepID=A0A8J7UKU4_9HYPH|nr:branched-chain amino acid ABC transporter permease [Tianweitania sediminis]MBP0438697.1 branched-chain amino acid ABC transporter permease [Tianweitania sediminis]HEV7414927.1 branched-chain amino acid ABC transporter permease [Tianweitania sediminis]
MTALSQTRAIPATTRHGLRDLIGACAILAVGVGCFFLFPNNLSFLTIILSISLLVMSLDLVTGVSGVATLGHAFVYGAGAYAAGIASVNGVSDPLLLLLLGSLAGLLAGVVSGALILKGHGLSQLVISIALVQLASEGVNKASFVTGGSDGLAGLTIDPLFGIFEFDLWGRTAFWLALAVVLVVAVLLRILVRSPFGMMCRGIHQDRVRVRAMGASVYLTLLKMYAISGFVGGLGGALQAVATQVVGLDSVSFTTSAEALVMLIFGGTGHIFGALAGTFVFMWFEHSVSAASPFHWLILVGILLILVVLFAPKGIYGLVGRLFQHKEV